MVRYNFCNLLPLVEYELTVIMMVISNIMHGAPMAAEPAQASRPATPPPDQGAVAAMEPARYVSPRLSFDMDIGVMIAEYRDVQSGELKAQFPSEAVVDRYRRSEALEAQRDHAQDKAPQEPARPAGDAAATATAAAAGDAAKAAAPARAPAPSVTAQATKTALSGVQPALVA